VFGNRHIVTVDCGEGFCAAVTGDGE